MIESQSVISYATESEGLKCVVGWVLLRDLFYMVKNGVWFEPRQNTRVYPHSTYCILLFCSAVICSSHFLQVEENVINHFYHMICVCLYERTSDVCCRRPQMRKQWCTIKTWLASNLHPSSSNIHIEDKHRPLHQSSHAAFCEWTLRIGPTFLKAI